jgi:O-6-methylguanine DNA methyltransferase
MVGKVSGTEFQRAVWNAMGKKSRADTRTYGEIAAAIGRPNAGRAVGSACGANPLPLFIPCHRVVARNGLGGFGPDCHGRSSCWSWKDGKKTKEWWSNGVLE